MVSFDWTPIRYRNVISVLKNPVLCRRLRLRQRARSARPSSKGGLRKSYGHGKPFDQWEVMLKDHHEAYIDWAEFERNQKQLAVNAYGRVDGVKAGRGGRALLAGMLCCGRCGRRLTVAYVGPRHPVRRCTGAIAPTCCLAQPRCFTFGGRRPDEAVSRELLRVVEPLAIEAAMQAERRHMEVQAEQRRIVELDLQQARYEAKLAERRYAACDPDNRLIAAQLEKSWESNAAACARPASSACKQFDQQQSAAPAPDFVRPCRGSRSGMERTWRDDALAPAVAAHAHQGHRRRCRRREARGGAHDPLARRTAFASAGDQATLWRARLPYAG